MKAWLSLLVQFCLFTTYLNSDRNLAWEPLSLGGQRIKKSLNSWIKKIKQDRYGEELGKFYPTMNSSVHCGFLMGGTQHRGKNIGRGKKKKISVQKKQKKRNSVEEEQP